ncbi:BrnT family toxin [Duganella violaceipulchra]|uniref:BrnT family toxin n=1 Tax=Duganella violaceipulchra TaxID=2849652 RepID=A0AA41HG94_9BURK|nr:BrnT family toxin [Duganella violaceicalia]
MTTYAWDEAKRLSNLRKHGLDFADAATILDGDSATKEDTRFNYPERRFNTLGYLQGKSVVVTYTEEEDVIRIISFRKASRRERVGQRGEAR